MLKRVIRYEVANNKTEVAIGPVNEIAGRIWNLHEFGGTATKSRKLKPHRIKAGEQGPDQDGKKGEFVVRDFGNGVRHSLVEVHLCRMRFSFLLTTQTC